ncbi:MAG: KOW domain-containing RNA-binding protein [Clostridia bacterium]|nr:KOW domain-containing RNA-binding protein [Clostridia bacterium]
MKVKIPVRGGIAQSTQGRDGGCLYVITEVHGQFVSVADGKTRTLENPKRKNVKHLRLLPRNISDEGIVWDKSFDNSIAHLLKSIKEQTNS